MNASMPLILLAILVLTAAGKPQTWDFERDTPGKIAKGFTNEVGRWQVAEVDGNKVLAQSAENDDPVFNITLISETNARDVDLNVKFQAVAGKFDQGGGLVWRAKDKNNYYVARYNPIEDNFRVYKVVAGQRTMLQDAVIVHKPGWHTLKVTMKGDQITCSYDGKQYHDVRDATFPGPGKIGLWSKADAQTYFDDLTLGEP
jgi:hypothetical protein